RDEEGELGAAEKHRIASPLTKGFDDLAKIPPGTVLEATVDELAEDDLVDTLAFLCSGNLPSDAVDRKFGSVDRSLHQVTRAQDPEALVAARCSKSRDLFGDMEPWNW